MASDILIIQTAFAGDLILTTPLVAATAERFPDAAIDVLCIPGTAGLLNGNPHVRDVITYDKRKRDPGLPAMMRRLARTGYDLCLSPHRSFRSALLARATGAPRRVAFDRTAAAWLYTHIVPYDTGAHEVDRNCSLLSALGILSSPCGRPALYPSRGDRAAADAVLGRRDDRPLLCLAPGSVWATKRWTEEGFTALGRAFADRFRIVLVGGPGDAALCTRIADTLPEGTVDTAGRLSFLASAALIGSARVLVSNDSAPVHIASAMGTPVVEIFGATVPGFGFTPRGVAHRLVQRDDLSCKPCAIHGGAQCPIKTFECMRGLAPDMVIRAVRDVLAETELLAGSE
ncbi:MAG: glycosyltransferase family 9 protein [Bacteroidota bacterium]|nr:glycosyltransferase family 9 protein [Bacteroidota bacterium]